MALIRILIDGYSLLHAWPEVARGQARHSALARDELIRWLTRYQDATGTPISVFFDGVGSRGNAPKNESTRSVEILFSKSGQTADDMIERAVHRFQDYGEVLAVTNDNAERETVVALGGQIWSCETFIREVDNALSEMIDKLKHHNRSERQPFQPFTMKYISSHHIIAIAAFLTALTAPLPGQLPSKTPQKQEGRFLFVLNTSSAMSRRSEKLQGIAGNLVASGLKGEIKNGDTLGVWTYNDTLHTGQFPLKRWSDPTRQNTAATLVEFIQKQKFEKRARFTNVMESLSALILISDRLTVLLLTDGSEKISGTPFDNEINQFYKLNDSDQRKAKMPFLVILRAEKGRFIGYKVNMPPWPVEFPKFTPEPEPAVVAPPMPVPEKKVIVPSLIISNPPSRVQIVPTISPSTNQPASTAISPSVALAHSTQSEATVTNMVSASNLANAVLTPPAVRTEENLAHSSPIRESTNSSTSNSEPTPRGDTGISRNLVWVAAICILLGITGLIFAITHRNRSIERVSLITRSMEDKRK